MVSFCFALGEFLRWNKKGSIFSRIKFIWPGTQLSRWLSFLSEPKLPTLFGRYGGLCLAIRGRQWLPATGADIQIQTPGTSPYQTQKTRILTGTVYPLIKKWSDRYLYPHLSTTTKNMTGSSTYQPEKIIRQVPTLISLKKRIWRVPLAKKNILTSDRYLHLSTTKK